MNWKVACALGVFIGAVAAQDQPRRHAESIGSARHEYTLRLGGTVDAANTRDPIVYAAWHQGFEPMRSVKLENTGTTDVVNPWVTVNGKRNWRTTRDIAEEAVRTYGATTPAEKARAAWEFLRRHRFHATTGDFEVRDPVKVFNVYGFALCGDNAPALMDLWRALGIPSRRGFPIGHCVADAWYDGGWHMLDGDESMIFLDRDNRTVASDTAVAHDHDLSKRSNADQDLPALYSYDGTRGGDYPAHTSHTMDFTLRPGESIEWRQAQGGKLHYAPQPALFLLKSNDLHEWGPEAWATLRNGRWTYTPPAGGPDQWKIRTPYAIVGGRVTPASAALSFSYDGVNWKPAAGGNLDPFFPSPGEPHYEYYLRAEGQRPASLTIESDLQMAPLAMPELELGENRITYTDESPGARAVRTTFEWVERSSVEPPPAPAAPVSPANGSDTEGTATALQWREVPGAAAYHFELGDEPGMRWALSPAFDSLLDKPRFDPPSAGLFDPGRRYYWRVRAKSAAGVWSAWSATWSFVPQAPGIPVNVRLEERDPDALTLVWEPEAEGRRPARYRVYASDEKGFSVSDKPTAVATGNQKSRGLFPGKETVEFPATFLAETAEPRFQLKPRHAFYRVVAVDEKGNRSGSSAYAEAPRPWIYTVPPREALAGKPYRYEAKTIRSIGDLSYRDFGPGQSYQSAYWDADQPKFSLEVEMPRCGNFDPKWLRIDRATGVLTGNPTVGDAGEYQVNIRVEIAGRAHVQSFPLKVAAPASLAVRILDENGAPTPARVYLTGEGGKPYFAPGAIAYSKARGSIAENEFVPPSGEFRIDLPAGPYTLEVERGKEYLPVREQIEARGAVEKTVRLRRWTDMATQGWFSGDMHPHRALADMAVLMAADDLNAALPITRWRHSGTAIEQDPGLSAFLEKSDAAGVIAAGKNRWFTVVNEELEPANAALLVSRLGRSGTTLQYPMSSYGRAARDRGALADSEKATSLELPALAALGGADFVGLANNHFWRLGCYPGSWGAWPDLLLRPQPPTCAGFATGGFEIYYALLNMGFPLKLSAGSASGVHPVPLGWSRIYAHVPMAFTADAWFNALQAGRTFVTTGPMLLLRVDGREPGEELRGAPREVTAEIRMLSPKPGDAAEIVVNGRPARVALARREEYAYTGYTRLQLDTTAWIAARWVGERDVAHTSPLYYRNPAKPLPVPREEAEYLAARVEKLKSAAGDPQTLALLDKALAVYRAKIAR